MTHPKHILTPCYYVCLLLTIVAAMVGYHFVYNKGIFFEGDSQASTTYYTIVLWYVIITLPLSLKGFSLGIKRLKKFPDDGTREYYYKTYAIIRMMVITLGLVASILGFYIFQVKHLFWLAGICIIGLIFSKPTKKRIDTDLTPLTPTEEPESDDIKNEN